MFERYSTILLLLAVIIVAAMLARWLADRCRQPSVLGELMLGIVIGNVGASAGLPLFGLVMHLQSADAWFSGKVPDKQHDWASATSAVANDLPDSVLQALNGPDGTSLLASVHALWVLANLGVLLLLFMAGLESSVAKMRRVGRRASYVALVGVIAPIALGFVTCDWLHPDMPIAGHLILAAALSATSVGITARILQDLDKLSSREAQMILGAAVIDDILALILLAIVAGIASTGLNLWEVTRITLVAALFLVAVLTVGERLAGHAVRWLEKLDHQNARLLIPLGFALAMAWLADVIQLAPIVGAFAAGLILHEGQFTPDPKAATVDQQIAALGRFLAPIFFLFTGMQVNLTYFLDWDTLLLAAVFTVVAVFGKFVAGVVAGRDVDRLSVGLGMIPRGEVGLIFVTIGRGIGAINQQVFAALVVVMVLTTLVTPPALKWSLFRGQEPCADTSTV